LTLYSKAKRDIERLINNGHYKPGDYLPSETELQEYYNVSRTTIRKAISLLVDEGLVTIDRGRGTRINSSLIHHKVSTLMSFTELMRQQGLAPKVKDVVAKKVDAEPEVAAKLQLEVGAPVLEVHRLRLADDEPISVNVSYLPFKWVNHIDPQWFEEEQSLYAVLENHFGIEIHTTEDVVRAINGNKSMAKKLNVSPQTPLLSIRRVAYNKNNIPMEYSKIFLRGDRYEHTITLKRK
jgi:GntR family transcriptional regulator